jgi:hypothetical protein
MMSPAQETKLFNRGCSVVLFGAIALGALGYFVHVYFAVAIIPLFAVWEVICRIKGKKDARILADAFDFAFEGFRASKPDLKKSNSYGFPSFTITFQTEDDMKRSEVEGRLRAFKDSIVALYGHVGSKERPFDVDMAVYPTYVGRVYDISNIPVIRTLSEIEEAEQ